MEKENRCPDVECERRFSDRMTDNEIKLNEKMDKDGPEGAYNIFQKKVPWIIWVPIILSIIGAAITTGYNVYSSEFKFAEKSTITSLELNTKVRLTAVEKDIGTINGNIEKIKMEQKNIREDQKVLFEDQYQKLEKLISND